MTKFGLITEVQKFYNGASIDFEKALKIYELEYGFIPNISEEISEVQYVNEDVLDYDTVDDCVTIETLQFMKDLQEGGTVNMLGSATHIRQVFGYSDADAKAVVKTYMKYYTELYHPENLI